MATATLTSRCQVTLPARVREALGIGRGDRVDFTIRRDGVVELRPASVDLLSLRGAVRPRVQGVTLEDMDRTIRAVAGSTGGDS